MYILSKKGCNMHALQIRNVPAELYNKLKQSSKQSHRSIAGEALSILEAGINSQVNHKDMFEQIDSVREDIRQNYGISESSVKIIREDRNR
jgi:plasmid stability protein